MKLLPKGIPTVLTSNAGYRQLKKLVKKIKVEALCKKAFGPLVKGCALCSICTLEPVLLMVVT